METQLEYQVSKENSQQQYSLSTMGTRALKENRADLEEKTNSLPEVSTEINKQSTRYQHINPLEMATAFPNVNASKSNKSGPNRIK